MPRTCVRVGRAVWERRRGIGCIVGLCRPVGPEATRRHVSVACIRADARTGANRRRCRAATASTRGPSTVFSIVFALVARGGGRIGPVAVPVVGGRRRHDGRLVVPWPRVVERGVRVRGFVVGGWADAVVVRADVPGGRLRGGRGGVCCEPRVRRVALAWVARGAAGGGPFGCGHFSVGFGVAGAFWRP